LIKIYRKNVHPKFPDGGRLTQYIENMKIDDTIRCQLLKRKRKLTYLGKGVMEMK